MAKARRHQLVITVTFDRLCSKRDALAAVRDCIHGDFYPTTFREGDPERFKVRAFNALPARHGRRNNA